MLRLGISDAQEENYEKAEKILRQLKNNGFLVILTRTIKLKERRDRMNRKTLPIVLSYFFFPFVIYATGVKGDTHVTLPTFITTKPGASITATAVDGWSMKSAEVDNLDLWTIPSNSGNNAATTYIPTSTSTFNVTKEGDLISPSGEGDDQRKFLCLGQCESLLEI